MVEAGADGIEDLKDTVGGAGREAYEAELEAQGKSRDEVSEHGETRLDGEREEMYLEELHMMDELSDK